MTHRDRYRAKIKAKKLTSKQSRARTEPYPKLDEEETEPYPELDGEGKKLLRKTQDDLEENLPHSKNEFMQQLQLQPRVVRREPDDEIFTTKIYLRRRNEQDVIPQCICPCYCGTDLALWKAKRRQLGITHAKVIVTNTE